MLASGISGFLLAVTYFYSAPVIAHSQEVAKQQAKQLVGGESIEVTAKGYGGDIKMLVGINTDGKVTGVKILSMTETPGLGTLATSKAPLSGKTFTFLGQFIGKTTTDKFKAKDDIVALTGATITSQAIANGIKHALEIYKADAHQ